jgi:hypothetical protein
VKKSSCSPAGLADDPEGELAADDEFQLSAGQKDLSDEQLIAQYLGKQTFGVTSSMLTGSQIQPARKTFFWDKNSPYWTVSLAVLPLVSRNKLTDQYCNLLDINIITFLRVFSTL